MTSWAPTRLSAGCLRARFGAMAGMTLLGSDASAGGLFAGRFRCLRRIGRRRQGGVGAVAVEPLFQFQDPPGQLVHLPLAASQLLLDAPQAALQTAIALPQNRTLLAAFPWLAIVLRHVPIFALTMERSRGLNGYSAS